MTRIVLSILMAVTLCLIPAWEIFWSRRRVRSLRQALRVRTPSECIFSVSRQDVGSMPVVSCICEDANGHFQSRRAACHERCPHAIHRGLIGTSQISAAEIASLLSNRASLQRIGAATFLALVPTATAIFKIWEK